MSNWQEIKMMRRLDKLRVDNINLIQQNRNLKDCILDLTDRISSLNTELVHKENCRVDLEKEVKWLKEVYCNE